MQFMFSLSHKASHPIAIFLLNPVASRTFRSKGHTKTIVPFYNSNPQHSHYTWSISSKLRNQSGKSFYGCLPGEKLLIVHKNVVHVSFLENFCKNFFEIPKPQVASFEELESGNPLGGEFAVEGGGLFEPCYEPQCII